MLSSLATVAVTALLASSAFALPKVKRWNNHTPLEKAMPKADYYVSYGPRPYYIINNMTAGPLKSKLQSCENGPFQISEWSIGHRGYSSN
jgi:glycerophosphoryl diester phosphodiesterase